MKCKKEKQLIKKLKENCEKGKGFCPWQGNPCDICYGLKEALAFECYKCNGCD